MTKICTKCGVEKSIKEFHINTGIGDGRRARCRKCISDYDKLKYIENRDKNRERRRRYIAENPEKVKESSHRSYLRNKEKVYERYKKWALDNPEKMKKARKESIKKKPDLYKEINRRCSRKTRLIPKNRLSRNISCAISVALKGNKKSRHWEDLVGYTISDIKGHLEKHFLPGMTWENYGKYGWHIDHTIPISAFNFDAPEHIDFKKCWRLANLKPMWAFDNLRKHNKLDEPFQPSLKLCKRG